MAIVVVLIAAPVFGVSAQTASETATAVVHGGTAKVKTLEHDQAAGRKQGSLAKKEGREKAEGESRSVLRK